MEIHSYHYVVTIPANAKPLIRIVDNEVPSAGPQHLGHELSFAAGPVLGDPNCLTLEIASALVQVAPGISGGW